MDEDAYKDTYAVVNPVLCCFEKAILGRKCTCILSHRFHLADREGVACQSQDAQLRCQQTLRVVRDKSRFALKRVGDSGQLPHNTELRIQAGTISGLKAVVSAHPTDDVDSLLTTANADFGDVESYPFDQIMRAIVQYKPRSRRSRRDT